MFRSVNDQVAGVGTVASSPTTRRHQTDRGCRFRSGGVLRKLVEHAMLTKTNDSTCIDEDSIKKHFIDAECNVVADSHAVEVRKHKLIVVVVPLLQLHSIVGFLILPTITPTAASTWPSYTARG